MVEFLTRNPLLDDSMRTGLAIGIVLIGLLGSGCSSDRAELEKAYTEAAVDRAEVEMLPNERAGEAVVEDADTSVNALPPTASLPAGSSEAPPNNAASRVRRSSGKRPGKLRLSLTIDDTDDFDLQAGPWLYINRKLVKCYHRQLVNEPACEDVLSLLSGTYTFEIAAATPINDPAAIPIQFHTWRMTIEADRELSHSFRVPDTFTSDVRPLKHQRIPTGAAAEWFREWADKAERKISLYRGDPLAKELQQLKAACDRRLPERPVFQLDIPEKFGGPREVDPAQVHLIARWLDLHYWHDWPDLVETVGPDGNVQVVWLLGGGDGLRPRDPDPDYLKVSRAWNQLHDMVQQHRDEIAEYALFAKRLPPFEE